MFTETLLEVYNPSLSVFSSKSFPNDASPILDVITTKALKFALRQIVTLSGSLIGNTQTIPSNAPSVFQQYSLGEHRLYTATLQVIE